MSKLYSKEDINTDKRLGYLEDALNEVFARLEKLERPVKKQKQTKKQLVSTTGTVVVKIRNGAKNAQR